MFPRLRGQSMATINVLLRQRLGPKYIASSELFLRCLEFKCGLQNKRTYKRIRIRVHWCNFSYHIDSNDKKSEKINPQKWLFSYSGENVSAKGIKVFRYSFLGTIPHFLNRLLDSLLLVRSTWNLQYLLVLDWTLAWFTFCKNRYFHDNDKQESSKTVKLKFNVKEDVWTDGKACVTYKQLASKC